MNCILFVNLTRLCNVNCPRCYLTPENRASKLRMPEGMLSDIMSSEFFAEREDPDHNPIVIFQGGEPTVVGERAFRGYIAEVQAAAPWARMTMVTNLLSLPDWAVDIAHEHFDSRIETTWAAGMKKTLLGSEEVFGRKFRMNLAHAVMEGLDCPVNVELNRETFEAGPRCITKLMRETGATKFEFDYSVKFDEFRASPVFADGGYPILPESLTHVEFRDFILGLRRQLHIEGLYEDFDCSLFLPIEERDNNAAFNTGREMDFITVNPDGEVTTNPLFSDIRETYIGDLRVSSFDEVLLHPNRKIRQRHEELRRTPCEDCQHFAYCQGGSSHVSLVDSSGECAGLKSILDRIAAQTA